MARLPMLRLVAVLVVVAGIGLSACGDDDGAVSPSTTPTSGAPGSSTTPTSTVSPTTATGGRVVEYAFRGGDVTGDDRVSVKLGEQLTVRVVSDVAEEIHVHTYDRTADLAPGVPGEVTFMADIPGVHEVELERSHLRLFSLEVR